MVSSARRCALPSRAPSSCGVERGVTIATRDVSNERTEVRGPTAGDTTFSACMRYHRDARRIKRTHRGSGPHRGGYDNLRVHAVPPRRTPYQTNAPRFRAPPRGIRQSPRACGTTATHAVSNERTEVQGPTAGDTTISACMRYHRDARRIKRTHRGSGPHRGGYDNLRVHAVPPRRTPYQTNAPRFRAPPRGIRQSPRACGTTATHAVSNERTEVQGPTAGDTTAPLQTQDHRDARRIKPTRRGIIRP